MYTIPKCDFAACEGHLGKHDNCMSEALWNAGPDYADEHGGDSGDFGAYMMLFHCYEEFTIPAADWGNAEDYVIPAGTFVTLTEASSGIVHMSTYPTDTDAQWAYDDHMGEFAIWEEANGY